MTRQRCVLRFQFKDTTANVVTCYNWRPACCVRATQMRVLGETFQGLWLLGLYYTINILGNWVLLNIFIAIITEQYDMENDKYESNIDAKIGPTALIEQKVRENSNGRAALC